MSSRLVTLPQGGSAASGLRERMLGTDARLRAELPEAIGCSITCAGGHGDGPKVPALEF
jgi:hypothetical protein